MEIKIWFVIKKIIFIKNKNIKKYKGIKTKEMLTLDFYT